MKGPRRPPSAFLILYMLVLMLITVLRPWNGAYRFLGGSVHLRVMADYRPILRTSLPLFLYLFVGNIAWFVPFGFCLRRLWKLPFPRSMLYGFLLSLFIETSQFVLGTGVSEIDDLILNTGGCLLGWLAAAGIERFRIKIKK